MQGHRLLGVGVALAIATGCTNGEQVFLEHRSTLDVQARGIVTDGEGDEGMVGMDGQGLACDFSTDGWLGEDYDTPNGAVVDGASPSGIAGDLYDMSFVSVSPGSVQVIQPGNWNQDSPISVPGIVTAAALPDGFVVLADDGRCSLDWHGPSGVSDSADVDVCAGSPSLVSDKATGTVFVANGGAIVSSDGDDTATFDTTGDLLAWDAHAEVLYTAHAGTSLVTALEPDGVERWTVAVNGGVTAIEALGQLEAVGVMVEQANGTGQFVVLDAIDGAVRSDIDTPSAAHDLTASANGTVVGMVLDWQVHWYDMTTDPLLY